MLAKAIRIRSNLLRFLCVWALYIPETVVYVLRAAMPVACGGHPNKHRLIEADFYIQWTRIFVAADRGCFAQPNP